MRANLAAVDQVGPLSFRPVHARMGSVFARTALPHEATATSSMTRELAAEALQVSQFLMMLIVFSTITREMSVQTRMIWPCARASDRLETRTALRSAQEKRLGTIYPDLPCVLQSDPRVFIARILTDTLVKIKVSVDFLIFNRF